MCSKIQSFVGSASDTQNEQIYYGGMKKELKLNFILIVPLKMQ